MKRKRLKHSNIFSPKIEIRSDFTHLAPSPHIPACSARINLVSYYHIQVTREVHATPAERFPVLKPCEICPSLRTRVIWMERVEIALWSCRGFSKHTTQPGSVFENVISLCCCLYCKICVQILEC